MNPSLNKNSVIEELVTGLREKKWKALKRSILSANYLPKAKLRGKKRLFILLMPQCKTMKFQQKKTEIEPFNKYLVFQSYSTRKQ